MSLQILWHSAAPWIKTGYGRVTLEVAARIHNTEHTVGLQSMASVRKDPIRWHGDVYQETGWERPVEIDEPMEIFPSSSPVEGGARKHFGVHDLENTIEEFQPDVYFTHFDTWMEIPRKTIPEMEIPYGSYVIVDHEPAPDAVVEQVSNAHEIVAMSKRAKRQLQKKGLRPRYIPHGVDSSKFIPIPEYHDDYPAEMEVRRDDGSLETIDLDERFIAGIVAANHADRKNIPEQMQAFNIFRQHYNEDAILYIHTEQQSMTGFDLKEVQKEIGLPKKNVIWTSADMYQNMPSSVLNQYYNAFDVLLNATRGESWGLTITESMAAGTPAIVTHFSSMPEQVGADYRIEENDRISEKICRGDHGLTVKPATYQWRERVSAKQANINPKDVTEALGYYYKNQDVLEEHSKKCRQHVLDNYTWEGHVVPAFKEMFNEWEQAL